MAVEVRPPPPLTPRQHSVLATFTRLLLENGGTAPSIRELGSAVGLRSTSTIQNHLMSLVRKGYLVHGRAYTNRRLRLAGDHCPMCGAARQEVASCSS